MSEATVGLRERDRHGGLRDRMGGTSRRRWYAVSLTSREKAPQVQSWSCSILTGGRAGAGPVGMSLGPGDLGEVWSEGLARVAAWPACWDLTRGQQVVCLVFFRLLWLHLGDGIGEMDEQMLGFWPTWRVG